MLNENSSPDSLLASFCDETSQGNLKIITGPSGAGKSSWCLSLAAKASALTLDPKGLISPAVFKDGYKVGIDLLDLTNQTTKQLAICRPNALAGMGSKHWQFCEETLQWGNSILDQLKESQFIILDELGPAELLHGKGLAKALEIVMARRYLLACVVVRPSLLHRAHMLWPWGQIIRINPEFLSVSRR